MPKRIKAKNFMTAKVITLSPEMDVFDAIKLMLEKKITGAPVVDSAGDMVGIFSEKDCLRLLSSGPYHELPGARVESYMRKKVETINEETDLLTIAHIFMSHPFRRLPVLRDGQVVGIVSRWDVMRMVLELNKPEPEKRDTGLYISALDD